MQDFTDIQIKLHIYNFIISDKKLCLHMNIPVLVHHTKLQSGNELLIYQTRSYNIHTYLNANSPGGLKNAAHIIETVDSLRIVDTFYDKVTTEEFYAYCVSLQKSIMGVFLTHGHPDHYLGLEVFSRNKVLIYALQGTIRELRRDGQRMLNQSKKMIGKASSGKLVVPEIEISAGMYALDSSKDGKAVKHMFNKDPSPESVIIEILEVDNIESECQMMIWFPDTKILIAGDMFTNMVHAYIPGNRNHLDNWIAWIEKFPTFENPALIFLGHGYPTDTCIYTKMARYLQVCREYLVNTNINKEQYVSLLEHAFPHYTGIEMVNYYIKNYKS